jgi:predicted Zn-dependent peptidase
VKAMTRQHFVDYRAKHYVAKGTIVVVAGNFDNTKMVKDIEKAFDKISTTKKHTKEKVKESQSEPKLFIKDKKTDQTHLILGVRAFDVFDKNLSKLTVLNAVLGGGMSSRLFQKLRDEMGVGYYVRSGSDEYTDHGYMAVSTGVDKSRVIEVVKAILAELKKLSTEDVPAHELAKAKEYLIGNMYLSLETSDSLAEFYGFQEILKGTDETPEEIAKKIEKVTAREVKEIAKKIFQNKSLNLALIGEIEDKDALKQALRL